MVINGAAVISSISHAGLSSLWSSSRLRLVLLVGPSGATCIARAISERVNACIASCPIASRCIASHPWTGK